MKGILRGVGYCCFILIILGSIGSISLLLEAKRSDSMYAAYFEKDMEIDVLFIGSSHVQHGFFPMELWNDYGITSYNLAGGGNTIPVSYWTLVNALDYHVPEVVVFDVYNVFPGRKFSEYWGQVQTMFDAYPLSVNKYRTVVDLFDDKNMTDESGNSIYEKRWEILWNLGVYHNRWNDIQVEDFMNHEELVEASSIWKGAEPLIRISSREYKEYLPLENLFYDEIAKEYLERMIELCAENNIELLLINTGYDCNDEAKLFADSVNDIAAAYKVPYIDFTKLDIINFESDLQSAGHNTHVNFSGAQKFTRFIGEELTARYNLSDRRNDTEYSRWKDDYQKYTSSKLKYLKQQKELDLYLLLLADADYELLIEVFDSDIFVEEDCLNVINNIGIDESNLGKSNLITVDVEEQEVSYIEMDYETGGERESSIGKISIWDNGASKYGIYRDGEEVLVNDYSNDIKLRIIVLDKTTTDIVDVGEF